MTRSLPTGPIPEGEVKNLGAMGRWAIAWARCGWPVFPCQPRGKEPIGKPGMAPHGFKDATLNEQVIAGWWRREPDANLGGVPELALDIDRPLIFKTWEFYAKVPQDAVTGSSSTKGHILMNLPEGWSGELETKFEWGEIRGNGMGYIILPPSVHPDGSVYRFRKTGAVPVAPDDLLVALTKPKTNGHDGEPVPLFGGSYRIPDFGYTGSRYDAIRDYVAHLWNKHLSDDELFGLVRTTLAPRFAETLTEAELRDRFERTMKKATERLGEPAGTVTIRAQEVIDRGPLTILDMLPPAPTKDFPKDPPQEAFRGPVGDLVNYCLAHTDAAEVGLLGAMLTTLGTILPTQAEYFGTQRSALFCCLVGESSVGRKGTTLYYAEESVKQALGKLYLDLQGSGVNSGEAIVNFLARQQAASIFGRLLVYEEEYSRLLVTAKREGMTTDAVMRAGFDGRRLGTMRAASGLQAVPPYILSALAGITPLELRHTMDSSAITNGSANRWMWLAVRRREGVNVDGRAPLVPPSLIETCKKAAEWIGQTPMAPTRLSVADRAEDTGKAYERYLLTASSGITQHLARRLHVIAMRVAMVHATMECSFEVTLDHYRRGVALTEYVRAGLAWVFGHLSGNEDSDYLYRQVMASRDGYITGHDICTIFRDPARRQRALNMLEDLGMARVETVYPKLGSKGGRPSTRLVALKGGDGSEVMKDELAEALYPEVALTSVPIVEQLAEEPEEEPRPKRDAWHRHQWLDRAEGAPFVCETCGLVVPVGAARPPETGV